MKSKRKICLALILILQLVFTMISMNTYAAAGIVTANGTSFALDGKNFRFAGCNSYDLYTYGDGFSSDIEGKFIDKAKIDDLMSKMSKDGVKVVRTWGYTNEDWHAFETSKGVYSEPQFKLFDYILESAKKNNIKLIVVLENYWSTTGGIDIRLKWEGLQGVTNANRAAFFTNAGCKQQYKNYVQHFVTRINHYTNTSYKDDPGIFAWELINEPRYQDVSAQENTSGTTLRAWIDEMGKYVKSLDPNHMVSVGLEGQGTKYGYGVDAGNPFVYIQQSPYINFTTAHLYPDESWANLSTAKAAALVDSWINDSHNVVKKPFVLEEFNSYDNKEGYWKAIYGETERLNASGDLFWDYAPYSGGLFVTSGDSILSSAFAPHVANMAKEVTPPTTKLGDLNGDGNIDALDYVQMKKYLLDSTGSVDLKVWDMNGDGQIDVLDLAALKRVLLNG